MIYLDHAATSPLRPEAWRAMHDVVGIADFNPASIHAAGLRAASVLEDARAALSRALAVPRASIVFTGGGTQADNLAILGFARSHEGARIIVSAVEHKAVLHAAARTRIEGARVDVLPVDADGVVNLDTAAEALENAAGGPALLSVMWANNETGVVQPVRELCELAHRHGAVFHTDAVQAFGRVPVSLSEVPADLVTLTAHKLGGPVGIGLLIRTPGFALEPLAYGGSQEKGLWPGTQNPVGAAGFAAAARLAADEMAVAIPRWTALRRDLEARLVEAAPGVQIHGSEASERLPHVLSVGLPGFDPAVFLTALDLEGIVVSSGSACSSGATKGSHVLEAMGIVPEGPYAVLRFSFGPATDAEDIAAAGDAVARIARRLTEAGA